MINQSGPGAETLLRISQSRVHGHQRIIELAQRGVHDAPTLTEMTLKELKQYLPFA